MTVSTALLVAAIIVAAVVLLELSARRWLWRSTKYRVHPPNTELIVGLSEHVSDRLAPVVLNRYNALGERASQRESQSTTGLRVLVAGGSAAECFFLDQDLAWPARLESLLNEPTALEAIGVSAVGVTTLARSAMRSRDVAEILERSNESLDRAAVVVLHLGSSDALQWLVRGAPKSYDDGRADVADMFLRHPEMVFRWRMREMALTECIRRVQSAVRPSKNVRNAGRFLRSARAMRGKGEYLEGIPDTSGLLENLERGIRRCFAAALRSGGVVYFVPQIYYWKEHYEPREEAMLWLGGIGDASTGAQVKYFLRHDHVRDLMQLVNSKCLSIASDMGVCYADITGRVRICEANFYDDFHLTAAGANELAGAIADVIVADHQSGMVGARSHPEEPAQPPNRLHDAALSS